MTNVHFNRKMVTVGSEHIELSAALPVDKQLWKDALCVVQAGSLRFVGLSEWAMKKETPPSKFMLHAALEDAARANVMGGRTPDGKPAFEVLVAPHILIPFSGLDVVDMYMQEWVFAFRVREVGPQLSNYYEESYMRVIDPPKVELATSLPTKPRGIT